MNENSGPNEPRVSDGRTWLRQVERSGSVLRPRPGMPIVTADAQALADP